MITSRAVISLQTPGLRTAGKSVPHRVLDQGLDPWHCSSVVMMKTDRDHRFTDVKEAGERDGSTNVSPCGRGNRKWRKARKKVVMGKMTSSKLNKCWIDGKILNLKGCQGKAATIECAHH